MVSLHLCVSLRISAVTRPNIVLVLTDDQDVTMGSTRPMEAARKIIAEAGAEFINAFTTSPICCPSRASILTGRYLHNTGKTGPAWLLIITCLSTGVRNNTVSGGCNDQRWREGLEKESLATILQGEGYVTMFGGKYLNQYGRSDQGGLRHVPPGWDWWLGLVGNSKYYNYTLSVNGKPEHHGDNYTRDYLTDVLRRHSVRFLDSFYNNPHRGDSPFFMMLAPPACHSPFTPAPGTQERFQNVTAPRTEIFNRDTSQDPAKHWLMMTSPRQMSGGTVARVDQLFQDRWRTLLSVDLMISKIVETVRSYNMMDNTYFIFTSDNGYHMGQFAMPLDKRLPYEFDVRGPFWMSGPGIKPSQVVTPVLNIDIAPTLLDLAGVDTGAQRDMDGLSVIPLVRTNISQPSTEDNEVVRVVNETSLEGPQSIINNYTGIQGRHNFLIEYSGEGSARTNDQSCEGQLHGDLGNLSQCSKEFDCKCQDARNNTYTCLRSLGQEDSVFCQFEDSTNFIEMYNLAQDKLQIVNLAKEISKKTIDFYKVETTRLKL